MWLSSAEYRADFEVTRDHLKKRVELYDKILQVWDNGGSAVLFNDLMKELSDIEKEFETYREEIYNKRNPKRMNGILEMLRPGPVEPQ